VNFWIGNHPLAGGEGDLSDNPQIEEADSEFRRAHPGLSPEELEPLYYRDALRSIAAQPFRWFLLLLRKLFYTVAPLGPSYTLHSTRRWVVSVVSYLLVLPLAIVGLGRLWHSERRPTAVLLLGASAVLVGIVFFPQERFRIPVIDPVLIISAGVALWNPIACCSSHLPARSIGCHWRTVLVGHCRPRSGCSAVAISIIVSTTAVLVLAAMGASLKGLS
jgi:hypothetical protein